MKLTSIYSMIRVWQSISEACNIFFNEYCRLELSTVGTEYVSINHVNDVHHCYIINIFTSTSDAYFYFKKKKIEFIAL